MASNMTFAEALAALERAYTFGINPTLEGVVELLDELGGRRTASRQCRSRAPTARHRPRASSQRCCCGEGSARGALHEPAPAALSRAYRDRRHAPSPTTTSRAASSAAHRGGGAAARRGRRSAPPKASPSSSCSRPPRCGSSASAESSSPCSRSGMGGRWDATSVVSPSVAVITGIGLDHTAILGEHRRGDRRRTRPPSSSPARLPCSGRARPASTRSSCVAPMTWACERARCGPASSSRRCRRSSTVRFRIVERPDRPGGDTVVDVDGVFARYESLALVRAELPGRQHRHRGRGGRGGARPRARSRPRSRRARDACDSRPLRAPASRTAGHRRRLAQPSGRRRARRGDTRGVSGSADIVRRCCSASLPTRTLSGSSRALAGVCLSVAVAEPDSHRALPAD